MRGDDECLKRHIAEERIPDIRLSLPGLVFRPIEHELWIAGNSQRTTDRSGSANGRAWQSARVALSPRQGELAVGILVARYLAFVRFRFWMACRGPPVRSRARSVRSSWGEPSASRIFTVTARRGVKLSGTITLVCTQGSSCTGTTISVASSPSLQEDSNQRRAGARLCYDP